jgi:hypothetical protein
MSLCLFLAAPTPAPAADQRVGDLSVASPWSRPTAPGATVGVVYFSITNSGRQADRLLAASSPIAATAEFHESRTVQGTMQMRAVTSVECPPGITKIEPGALHVMLVGLKQPLAAGTRFALTLRFRDAGSMTMQVPVENRE